MDRAGCGLGRATPTRGFIKGRTRSATRTRATPGNGGWCAVSTIDRGGSRQDVLELFRFLDGVLVLPEAAEDRLWAELPQYEEQ